MGVCVFCFFVSFDLTFLHLTLSEVATVNMSQKTAQESDQMSKYYALGHLM